MPEVPAKQAVTTPPAGMQAGKPTADLPSRPGQLGAHDPQQIGQYRVLEKLGEGGMGVIYKAEQRQPVRRIVALKVIKLGMDTKQVIARFEAERQALAMLSHPNVAKVLDAGMTELGRPFFAMEFVAGIPLTDYCDHRKLTTRERLELLIPICQAVQHAHQKGIIHRDLKPSNILVAVGDGKAVPKVIDFGIAKATNSQLTQQTLFTQTGAMVGTPEYMSPEQAKTSGLDVDTRTDIYSLGAILYELLTGTLPFDPEELRKAGVDGMARIIQETEPHKPSTRITFLRSTPKPDNNCDEIAKRHRTDPKTLRRELRGDLDWIVVKAMEKDPSRRYQTANALAADIKRFLENEPISARPPSAGYRFRKLIRRHRLAFASVAAVAIVLVAGLIATTVELLRAESERQRAVNETIAAEGAKSEAVAANAVMRDLFTSLDSSTGGTTQLDDAVRRLDSGWLADQPDTAAGCRLMIAQSYATSGNSTRAEQQFNAVLNIVRRARLADAPQVAAAAFQGLGSASMTNRDYPSAIRNFQAAVAECRKLPDGDGRAAALLDKIALARQSMNDPAGARVSRAESIKAHIAATTRQIAQQPSDGELYSERAFYYMRLAQFRFAEDDLHKLTVLEPSNSNAWYYLASVRLYLKDEEGYRQAATQMYQQFNRIENRQTSSRLVLTCLLTPTPVGNVKRLNVLADVASGGENVRALNFRWFYICKALMEYRDGRFNAALQWTTRARGATGLYAPHTIEFIEAMSQQQLGQPAVAREEYRRAVEQLEFQAPRLDVVGNAAMANLNLSDYVVCQIIRREADTLFAGKSATRPASPSVAH